MGWGKAGLEIIYTEKDYSQLAVYGMGLGRGGCGYYALERLYSIGCIGTGWGGAGLGIICIENVIVALQCMGWG